jgi:chromosome segregation ATPase
VDKRKVSESEEWEKNYSSDIKKNQDKLDTLSKSLGQLEEDLIFLTDELKEKTGSFQRQLDLKKAELAPWNEKINLIKANIDVKYDQLDCLRSTSKELEDISHRFELQKATNIQKVFKKYFLIESKKNFMKLNLLKKKPNHQ